MAAARTRYTTVAVAFHWGIAAAIVIQILLGLRMGSGHSATTYALFQLHKSVGITILILSLGRLTWRLANPPPPAPVGQPRWERIASHVVHWGFYVAMIGLPLTGWLIVSSSRTDIPTILYGLIPWPHLPGVAELPATSKHVVNLAASTSHELLVKLIYALLALHLGAVAKHQLLDRDEVFGHMAVGARPGWREPRLWLAGAGALAVVAFGLLFTPSVRIKTTAPAAPVAPPPAPLAMSPGPAPATAPPAAAPAPKISPNVAPAAAPKTPVAQAPISWKIQSGSTLGFSTSWSGQAIEGRFKTWDGDILFSPDALDKSKLTIRVDLASATTGDDQRDSTLPTPDWFDVPAHPAAVFTASRFKKSGPDRFLADGTLALRGVSKPVAVAFSLKIDGDTALAQGSATVNRTTFGVGQGEWAATDQIPAEVKLSFSLTAKAK
jgi:cytochrome b561/polyisoprenoid-binding protein YceI